MTKKRVSYRQPILIAIVVHIFFIALIVVTLSQAKSYRSNQPKGVAVKTVHAVTINQAAVTAQIKHIQDQQALKRHQQQMRVQRLQRQAKRAQQRRLREQQRLKKLRLAEQRLKAQQQARQKAQARQQRLRAARAKAQQAQRQRAKLHHLALQQQRLQQKLLQQQLASEHAQLAKQRAAQMQGVVNEYMAKVTAAIRQNWRALSHNKNRVCTLLVNVAPGGVVLGVKVVRSSGDVAIDRLAKTAVFKSSPLPVPKNPALFAQFRQFTIKMTP